MSAHPLATTPTLPTWSANGRARNKGNIMVKTILLVAASALAVGVAMPALEAISAADDPARRHVVACVRRDEIGAWPQPVAAAV